MLVAPQEGHASVDFIVKTPDSECIELLQCTKPPPASVTVIAERHSVAVLVLVAYTIFLGSYVLAPVALALPIELTGAAVSLSVARGAS
jgi:hypothetical protein